MFFCYALPAVVQGVSAEEPARQGSLFGVAEPAVQQGLLPWAEAAGRTAWYLSDIETGQILEEASSIIAVIRCQPDTPRLCAIEKKLLSEIRAKVEKHIKNTYLKSIQAPIGVKPALKAWMELS